MFRGSNRSTPLTHFGWTRRIRSNICDDSALFKALYAHMGRNRACPATCGLGCYGRASTSKSSGKQRRSPDGDEVRDFLGPCGMVVRRGSRKMLVGPPDTILSTMPPRLELRDPTLAGVERRPHHPQMEDCPCALWKS